MGGKSHHRADRADRSARRTTSSQGLELSPRQKEIAERILREIGDRLSFLVNVGLDYLTLDRTAATLSGGEAQRIRLATQIGSSLVGVLYILDEPSIGLHQRDNARLLDDADAAARSRQHRARRRARRGDDPRRRPRHRHGAARRRARRAHRRRGHARGHRRSNTQSLTGRVSVGAQAIDGAATAAPVGQPQPARCEGAREHNLRERDRRASRSACFTCVTGVSGSGKSTLVIDTLLPALAQRLQSRQGAGRARTTGSTACSTSTR